MNKIHMMQEIIGKEITPSDSNPKTVLNEKSPAVIDDSLNSAAAGDEKGEGYITVEYDV